MASPRSGSRTRRPAAGSDRSRSPSPARSMRASTVTSSLATASALATAAAVALAKEKNNSNNNNKSKDLQKAAAKDANSNANANANGKTAFTLASGFSGADSATHSGNISSNSSDAGDGVGAGASTATPRRRKHDTPDRLAAFEKAAEHESFRTQLYSYEKPRQVLFLGIGAVLLTIGCILRDRMRASSISSSTETRDLKGDVQAGFLALTVVFTLYCALQLRDSLMVRPHPMFWRIVHGCGIIYLCCLGAVFVQDIDGARHFVALLAPGQMNLTSKPFDGTLVLQNSSTNALLDCAVNGNTVYRQVTSVWFLSHLLGWTGKMMIFRDFTFTMLSSLFFELEELSLQFLIPEFKECWWDSIFIDFLGANLLGIFAGYYVNKYLNCKPYPWMDEVWDESKHDAKVLVNRIFDGFMPFVWFEYRWQFFSSFRRFSVFMLFMIGQLIFDVNAFFLLHLLNIPVNNKLNHLRLLLSAFVGAPAVSESYAYITGKASRFGPNLCLFLATIVLETMVIVRFGAQVQQFRQPPPMDIVLPWLAFTVLLGLWVHFYYWSKQPKWVQWPLNLGAGHKLSRDTALRFLLLLAFAPLGYLCKQWAF
eukprot:m.115328 g.115328  ORF g.115328 m.115328 type:complete len:595 (+) comp16047_c5_seq2:422-2206(+)